MEPLYSICIGDLEIRPHEHVVRVNGVDVPLTPREFAIVLMLAEHPGWAYNVEQLSRDSAEGDYSPESVSVLVSRIRKKLATADSALAVETVRGIGYRLHSSAATCDWESLPPAGPEHELRDAWWQLQEAVVEAQRVGNAERQHEVSDLLEQTRRAVRSSLEG